MNEKLHSYDVFIAQIHVSRKNEKQKVIWQVSGKKEYLQILTNILANTKEVIAFK